MHKVTIKDIARLAGVSTSSVSRALSGSSDLSTETSTRILEICKKEGYRVNALARGLIRNKTNVLGLIVQDITNPYYAEIALGIETRARSLGYNVILCNSQYDSETTGHLFEFLLSHQVDGIIMASSCDKSSSQIPLYASTIPIVLFGPLSVESEGDSFNVISVDNFAGGKIAAEYLLSLGHKRIAYLGHRISSPTHQLRYHGFLSAIQNDNITIISIENHDDHSSINTGHELCVRLLAEHPSITAIFASTDLIALGALQAAKEAGLDVPNQLSILGFDNILYSSLPTISLSTIDQRKDLIANTAVELLIDIIQNNREDSTQKLIKPRLIHRNSCCSI